MTSRELEILNIIKENPLISQDELAFMLGITRSGVAAHIHNLMKKGYIKGKGYVLNNLSFVTVIGGINIDIMGLSSEKLISNNSNPGKINFTLGGAGRNISLVLTKLNIPNYLISVYGDDMNGEKFVNNSKENNMDIQCCERIANEHTSTFLYIDDASGKKILGIDDMDIYKKMTPSFVMKYIDKINASKYCVIDTNIPVETFDYIYKNVTTPIVIKTTSINKNFRLISPNQQIHTLIATPAELKELLNFYGEHYVDLETAMAFMLTKNIENIIVFSISEGLFFLNRNEKIYLKKVPNEIVNTNGVSAVLTGVYVWGLQNSIDWEKNLRLAYSAAILSMKSNESVNHLISTEEIISKEKTLFNKRG
ncbi:PfkB family carbohydrate kinase [Vagococcus sp.]|uniref:PfkB family carbohydrate kinase n=1 Tax=Vagococcus sp. TaxID=1933889 RepID=UPI003F97C318